MTVFRSTRVLLPDGLKPATVHVRDGKIIDVAGYEQLDGALVDAGDDLLTPGVVDSHVHINEPGRTDWEGFRTATEAAAAGGITTVVDMPLNCIPATTSQKAAEAKLEALRDQLHVDVAFWGGVVPGNVGELEGLRRFGVPGCKCFLCPSGVDEFPHVSRADLDAALPRLRDLGLTLLVHAEAPDKLIPPDGDADVYDTYLRSRPPASEDAAIAMIIELCRKHSARAHIVHLSSASALPMLKAAQADGVRITAETCLHYLTFAAEDIPRSAMTFKCSPPIRERANQRALWQGLSDGTVGMVVSDHSPCTPQLKRGTFLQAWGGIASLQLGLSVLYTEASKRGHSLERLFEWNARAPAELAGLGARKGRIAKGYDADLVIWNDRESFTVSAEQLKHKHKLTPYAGRTLKGRVRETYVRGTRVFPLSRPQGTFLPVTG
jgi:allantoinase